MKYNLAPGAGKTSLVISPSIIGGQEAVLGQFPWQAFILTDDRGACGGSLILVNWVLTAAHCIGYENQKLSSNFTL